MSALEAELENLLRRVIREELQVLVGERDEDLLTAEEAAKRIGCNKQRVYALKREGHLTAIYTGETTFKFAPEEIRRFIREQGTKHIATDSGTGLECASEATQ